MQWLLTAHAQRHHRHYGTRGHVWQGRLQGVPDPGRRPPRRRPAPRRAHPVAGRAGRAGRGPALVEPARLDSGRPPAVARRAPAPRLRPAEPGRRTALRRPTCGAAVTPSSAAAPSATSPGPARPPRASAWNPASDLADGLGSNKSAMSLFPLHVPLFPTDVPGRARVPVQSP